jgi:protocatechuate 3,4-dioxygenase beta subunit
MIESKRRSTGRWRRNERRTFMNWIGIIAAVVILSITPARSFGAEETRPDLTGRVTGDQGSPLAKATVFVYSAGPKQGTASVCPYCYADCRKKVVTGADGAFKIESLDPQLIFRLLVVAKGHDARFVTKVDPAKGPVNVALNPIDDVLTKSKGHIAGKVMDPEGRPVAGATISPEGVEREGHGTQWGGTDAFVDPIAVADEQGRFVLFCSEGVTTVHAVAEGPNVAKRWMAFKPGRDYLVRLQEGVAVTGRVEKDGLPAEGVAIGLSTSDRTCGNFFRCDELATDKDGRFLIPNIPAEREFALCASMDSLHGHGALPIRTFTTGKTGTTMDLGKLMVQPAYTVVGRVVLSDGKNIPPKTRLFLGREKAWDHTEVMLDESGHFEFKGVPSEPIGLSVRIKGYKFSKKNPSLDWLNGGIVGTVTGDIKDLVILMEPGEWRYNARDQEDMPTGGDSQPYSRPLRGAGLARH